MITVVCYDTKETWSSRKNALKYYRTGMLCCDENSHEWIRYDTIVCQLRAGYNYCCDDEDVYTEEQAKAVCDSCERISSHDEAWRMAKC